MFCTNCGRSLPEDGTPCTCGSGQKRTGDQEVRGPVEKNVGTGFTQPSASQNPYPQKNSYQQSPYIQPQSNPYIQPPSAAYAQPTEPHKVFRKIVISPIFLTACILMSVGFVLMIIQTFISVNDIENSEFIMSILTSFFPVLEQNPAIIHEIIGGMNHTQLVNFFVDIPKLLIPGFIIAGLWVTFASAKKNEVPPVSGLTMLQVTKTVYLVCMIISAVVTTVGMVIIYVLLTMLIQSTNHISEDDLTIFFIVLMILILAIIAAFVFMTIYTVKTITSINGVRKMLRTGRAEKPASMFVAVSSFILAANAIFDSVFFGSVFDWINSLSTLCNAGALILFALCIIQYNKAIKPLIAPRYMPQSPVPPGYYPPHQN